MNKEKIIQKSDVYSQIISEKKVIKNRYYSIYYQNTEEKNKYGISVPKKIGKAYQRNKLKRQIKNIIITNEKNIPLRFNYVIIIKEATLELSYQEMTNELLNIIKKVGN